MPASDDSQSKTRADRDLLDPTVVFQGEPARPATGDASPAPPSRIGRYRVERVLGKGGFGVVYLAHDDQLQRRVAIKVPHSQLVEKTTDAEAYLMEARTVANLDHPHIVPVFDVGCTDQFPCYVVSKYIDGADLAARLQQTRLPLREAVDLVATVAEALHHAHKQGLVHRDIKPGNILLDGGNKPFVGDFGLALREQDVGRGPRFVGTPAYMSPEQARGEGHRVDGRSDVFSLGAVLYELLTGRQPFRADSRDELVERTARGEVKPPRQIDDSLPKELDRICLKALSKRASERYSTAADMADDLRHFLAESQAAGSLSMPDRRSPGSDVETAAPAPSTAPASDREPVRIVPKGLRSFDATDADFFLELLSGPRDRDGLPESVRFWKTRIESTNSDGTFPVGLIYGPSGCGKSSLVRAGLLPRLSKSIAVIYVEAAASDTEARLLRSLRRRLPVLPEHLGLIESLAALRQGRLRDRARKVLLIVDQFEQWLHSRGNEEDPELIQALRQCDGERLQCILMVRDDFWMATSSLMRELEVGLLEGHNSTAVDLFPMRHARKVLAALGRAFGELPAHSGEDSHEQRQFVDQAVAGLAQEGRVIPVRLALFAEMFKSQPWTPATLKQLGGAERVGVTFLEETFNGSTALPQRRLHQKAAQAVLKALLPDAGTDIKGHRRSEAELREGSGYAARPRDFEELLRILDGDLRLITPTDSEGREDPARPADPHSARCYQLTHDYLVPALRDWLTRKQKETRRGRATLLLAERSALWQARPENRHLPSWWEYLNAVWFVPRKDRTDVQRSMLARAGRVHSMRWGAAALCLLAIGFFVLRVFEVDREISLRRQAAIAVQNVDAASGDAVASSLTQLSLLPDRLVKKELARLSDSAEPDAVRSVGLAYARALFGDIDWDFLIPFISRARAEELPNLIQAFSRHSPAESLSRIHACAQARDGDKHWRFKARLAILALHLADPSIAADMCRIDGRLDPVQRTVFIDELSDWHVRLVRQARRPRMGALQLARMLVAYQAPNSAAPLSKSELAAFSEALDEPALRSALCLGFGSIAAEESDPGENDLRSIVLEWYTSAEDSITHSAAGWTLRQWGVDVPALPTAGRPADGRDWSVNSLGMVLVKVPPGQFVRRGDEDDRAQTVTLTRACYLGDREVNLGQFRAFFDDPQCPDDEKPVDWEDRSSIALQPVTAVNWFDAILFCNWLSRKEGLAPCYERTGRKEQSLQGEFDEWRLTANGTGYRLPTEAEWEYACRAGTTTEFACGTDPELLRKYAVFQTGTTRSPAPCGSQRPNSRGLFDTHGNVGEWCYDWFHESYDLVGEVSDPAGPAGFANSGPAEQPALRARRGGSWNDTAADCRSGARSYLFPGSRDSRVGFRVARTSAQ